MLVDLYAQHLDCSPPSSSVHGILQARILESVAIPFSRGSSQPRDWIWASCIADRFFTVWATCWGSFKEGFSSFAAHDNSLGTLFNMEVPCTHPRRFWFRTKVSQGLCISEPLLSSLSKWFFCKRTAIFTRRNPEGKYWIKDHEFPSSGRSQKAWINTRRIPVQGGLSFFPKEPVKLHASLLTMLLIQQMNSVFLTFVQCSLGLQRYSHPVSPLTCSPGWSWWG